MNELSCHPTCRVDGRFSGRMQPVASKPDRSNGRAETNRTSSSSDDASITGVVNVVHRGDKDSKSRLLPLVLQELCEIARFRLSKLRPGQTLTPTDLAHDAFLRLVDARRPWENRRHFFGAASRLMRDMIGSEARKRRTQKRGGKWTRVPLETGIRETRESPAETLSLREALEKLETVDSLQHRIVMLRFFHGLSSAEIAGRLGISERSVRRHWRFARAWLFEELR